MSDLHSLIDDLASTEPAVRNRAALQLMDIGDANAVEPLIRAILKPENVNHRGTLVFALGAFDCGPWLETLVDLALTGNFEVCVGACGIVEQSAVTPAAISRIKAQLGRYEPGSLLAEHQQMAFEALSELIR
jgi:HEAT repeat protein